MLKLAAARQKGVTPFYSKELARFEREDREPMDAAWNALPPTERQMFLVQDEASTRDNSGIDLLRMRSVNHK